MNIRKSIAALVAAGALATGVGGAAAFADTTTTASPPAAALAKHSHCDKAADHITKWRGELTKLDGRLDKLRQERAKAVDAHKEELVKKIDARIDKATKHHVEIENRIDGLQQVCNLPK